MKCQIPLMKESDKTSLINVSLIMSAAGSGASWYNFEIKKGSIAQNVKNLPICPVALEQVSLCLDRGPD